MSKLKAVSPTEAEPTKPKMVIYGPSGVGKTWFAISFPAVYYISPEPGATRKHYTDRLAAGGGVYFGPEHGATDFQAVIDEIKTLAAEKHSYKTLVIDSISEIYNLTITKESERLGDKNQFGADKKPAISYMKRCIDAIRRLDMNVIFVAHEKAEWGMDEKGQRTEIGKTPDCWDKLIYSLDMAFQIQKRGANRYATTKKTRLTGFPEGESYPLTFKDFSDRYGKDIIEKASVPITLATADQVTEINRLVDLLKIDSVTTDKWLEKSGAETFAEFTTDQATKVIDNLKSKIK